MRALGKTCVCAGVGMEEKQHGCKVGEMGNMSGGADSPGVTWCIWGTSFLVLLSSLFLFKPLTV